MPTSPLSSLTAVGVLHGGILQSGMSRRLFTARALVMRYHDLTHTSFVCSLYLQDVWGLLEPPTTSPTNTGNTGSLFYPDYTTTWPAAGCINDLPVPSGRPTYTSRLAA